MEGNRKNSGFDLKELEWPFFFSNLDYHKHFYCGGLGHMDNKMINIPDHNCSEKAFASGMLSYS